MFTIAAPSTSKEKSKLVDKKAKKYVGFKSLWDAIFDNKFH